MTTITGATNNGAAATSKSSNNKIPATSGTLHKSVDTSVLSASMMAIIARMPPLPSGLGLHGTPEPVPQIDTTTESFKATMTGLLKDASERPGASAYLQDELKAFANGTINVVSPNIAAAQTFVTDDAGQDDGYQLDVDTDAWSDFLTSHMASDGNGSWIRNTDGSFVDSATGNKADYAQIGGNFFYVTWPNSQES